MAKLTVTKIFCERKQDVVGEDEPVLELAGKERWWDKMGNNESDSPSNLYEEFTNSISVRLIERNDNNAKKDKTLGSWTLGATPKGSQTLTATSSGYEYRVYVTIS